MGTACSAGSCRPTCAAPLTTCSGACVNTAIDPSNCGSCGRACALSHASACCLGGGCGVAVCDTGYFDCNRIASDGCESVSVCLSTVVTFNAVGTGRTGSLQRWTVPPGVTTAVIEAWGAQGGGSPTTGACNCSLPGGRGAYVRGTFSVTPGSVLDILVGQVGGSSGGVHGNENGGGGTFVVLNPSTPLAIAGGGGGGPSTTYGTSCTRTASVGDGQAGNAGASTSCSTSAAGGSAGGGGMAAGTYEGGAGGGFTGDGANGGMHCALAYGGLSYTNGGAGGLGNTCYDTNNFGGYGGGGGQLSGPGGGGGYSGGSTSGAWAGSSSYGGGGGSYNAGAGQTNTPGVRSGMGLVTITY